MRFGKNHKVIFETLNELEAAVYRGFLEYERIRHQEEVEEIGSLELPKNTEQGIVMEFLHSSVLRHTEDIEGIDKLLTRIKDKFG